MGSIRLILSRMRAAYLALLVVAGAALTPAALDAAILQSLVLAPLLGIEDPRTSQRIDFVGGIRGSEELVRRVEARGGGVAFGLSIVWGVPLPPPSAAPEGTETPADR